MVSRIIAFVLAIFLVVLVYMYTISCENERAAKLKLLGATRSELGNVEQNVMECTNAVVLINKEISKISDIIVQKKENELAICKSNFTEAINIYKTMYKAAYGRDITQAQIDEMKRRLGITLVT